ncbi:hypothetical protein D3C76_1574390 [compost metagenome]
MGLFCDYFALRVIQVGTGLHGRCPGFQAIALAGLKTVVLDLQVAGAVSRIGGEAA